MKYLTIALFAATAIAVPAPRADLADNTDDSISRRADDSSITDLLSSATSLAGDDSSTSDDLSIVTDLLGSLGLVKRDEDVTVGGGIIGPVEVSSPIVDAKNILN